MIGKIAAAAVAAIVLATAGAASAQTRARHAGSPQLPAYATYADSYFNKDYWDAIASPARLQQHDPYVGTVWEGIAPY